MKPGRLSIKAARGLDSDEQGPADTRPAQIDRLVTVSTEIMETLREVFAGTTLLDDQTTVAAVLEARREVETAWGRAKASVIEIGRVLNRLDARLRTKEERAALKAGFSRLFPVSEPIASQFRRVAAMIDSGRVPIDACPASYSAAYQLALLPPDGLAAAKEHGLIAPNTSRATLIAFRRSLTMQKPTVDFAALMAEQRRILATRRRLLEELIQLRRRSKEISETLSSDG